VNFKSVVNVSQTVAKGLVASGRTQGATIVNISSVVCLLNKNCLLFTCKNSHSSSNVYFDLIV
jgi:short-subunit dehydrogenase